MFEKIFTAQQIRCIARHNLIKMFRRDMQNSQTKLVCVYEGLRYVRNLGVSALELHVDCLIVANMLSKGEESSPIGRFVVLKIWCFSTAPSILK